MFLKVLAVALLPSRNGRPCLRQNAACQCLRCCGASSAVSRAAIPVHACVALVRCVARSNSVLPGGWFKVGLPSGGARLISPLFPVLFVFLPINTSQPVVFPAAGRLSRFGGPISVDYLATSVCQRSFISVSMCRIAYRMRIIYRPPDQFPFSPMSETCGSARTTALGALKLRFCACGLSEPSDIRHLAVIRVVGFWCSVNICFQLTLLSRLARSPASIYEEQMRSSHTSSMLLGRSGAGIVTWTM